MQIVISSFKVELKIQILREAHVFSVTIIYMTYTTRMKMPGVRYPIEILIQRELVSMKLNFIKRQGCQGILLIPKYCKEKFKLESCRVCRR